MTFGEKVIQRLKEFTEYLESGKPIEEKYRVRKWANDEGVYDSTHIDVCENCVLLTHEEDEE